MYDELHQPSNYSDGHLNSHAVPLQTLRVIARANARAAALRHSLKRTTQRKRSHVARRHVTISIIEPSGELL